MWREYRIIMVMVIVICLCPVTHALSEQDTQMFRGEVRHLLEELSLAITSGSVIAVNDKFSDNANQETLSKIKLALQGGDIDCSFGRIKVQYFRADEGKVSVKMKSYVPYGEMAGTVWVSLAKENNEWKIVDTNLWEYLSLSSHIVLLIFAIGCGMGVFILYLLTIKFWLRCIYRLPPESLDDRKWFWRILLLGPIGARMYKASHEQHKPECKL